jgi:hypothetical protein
MGINPVVGSVTGRVVLRDDGDALARRMLRVERSGTK